MTDSSIGVEQHEPLAVSALDSAAAGMEALMPPRKAAGSPQHEAPPMSV